MEESIIYEIIAKSLVLGMCLIVIPLLICDIYKARKENKSWIHIIREYF